MVSVAGGLLNILIKRRGPYGKENAVRVNSRQSLWGSRFGSGTFGIQVKGFLRSKLVLPELVMFGVFLYQFFLRGRMDASSGDIYLFMALFCSVLSFPQYGLAIEACFFNGIWTRPVPVRRILTDKYIFSLMCTGILFGVFQAMHVYLGFNYTGTGTMAVMPGTLPEYLTYLTNPHLWRATMTVALIGAGSFVLYFFMTRLYFRYLALDLFHVGDRQRLVDGTIEAVGGVANIKMTQSSQNRLVVSLYDPTKLNVNKLRELGSIRITETRAGYSIAYGAASTMVRIGIIEYMRDSIRSVNR